MHVAKKLTEMALIKKLDRMNHEEMKKIIVDLYKFNKSVEEGICLQLLGEDYGSALLEKYKKRIHKIFNPTNIVRKGFSLESAQMVLLDFAKVCVNNNERWYGDLALYFTECATEFIMSYGDMNEAFYDALGEPFVQTEWGDIDPTVFIDDDGQAYMYWGS